MLKENKIVKTIARWKIYTDRARSYIGYIQFLMTATILLKVFKIDFGIIGYVILFLLFIFGCLVIGFLDTWLGLRREEITNANQQNKILLEIYERIKEYESNSSHPGSWEITASDLNDKAFVSKE